ncbi:MAG: elongation factor G [Anaerolineaceae bacterium 4572_32.1]|nr:MAG: elongation factor G [Anaerolineaceae bacterium 4572_32.1]
MELYGTEKLRNISLLAHGSAGKTSLAEALLFSTGAINRLGKVEEGTTVADFDEEEIARKISLGTALVPCEWKGHKINVLDTPGYADFIGEVRQAVRASDAVIILIDSVAGVEVGTEMAWTIVEGAGLPRMVVVNKMDRDNANFQQALESLKSKFDATFVPFQLPLGSQSSFRGVVDLVSMKAYEGQKGEEVEIPAEMQDQVEEYRLELVEAAAEADDELIMKYLEGEELDNEEIGAALKTGVQAGAIVPVFCTSATSSLGIQTFMDAVITFVPSPLDVGAVTAHNPDTDKDELLEATESAPLAALVFKTTADPFVGKLSYFRVYSGVLSSDTRVLNSRNGEDERIGQILVLRGKEQLPVKKMMPGDIATVAKLSETLTGDTLCNKDHPLQLPGIEFPNPLYAVAVSPKTQSDSAKLNTVLTRVVEEDPSMRWYNEPSTRQTILAGMGNAHIDIAVRRMARKFGTEVIISEPKVPYKETITREGSARYRHKKQTGGAGQFAEVELGLEPLPRDTGFEYEWKVFGGAISRSFQPSIEKGIKKVMGQGVIAGYPVVDVRASVIDGKEHPVDSKDIAFQIAGREVFKEAVLNSGPVLLEPVYNIKIVVPEQFMGDVLGDLNTRRAQVQGMNQERGNSIVTAQAPLAEIQRYSIDLRSLTQGRGYYSIEFSHYQNVPTHIAQQLIEAAKKEKDKQ